MPRECASILERARRARRDGTSPSPMRSVRRRAHLRAGDDIEIRACQCGPKECLGAAPTPPATLVHLEVRTAEVVAPVELVDLRNPALRGGLAPGIQDLPVDPTFLDAQFAAGAVVFVGAVLVVLAPTEHGQDIVPGPATVAELRPVVVVARLAAHVDHGVDGRAAAENLATRITDGPAVQAGFGLGSIAPVGPGIADGVEIADGNVDPEVVVLAACLDE